MSESPFVDRDHDATLDGHDGGLASALPGRTPLSPWADALRSGLLLNVILFAATLVTTTVFGYGLVRSFSSGHAFDLDWIFDGYVRLWRTDPRVWAGLWFSVPLLSILLAHEFGHYLECRKWKVDATLPFFLPSPTLFGTLGAFIRIRSPIYARSGLFDIGISGPLAGFAVLLPFLVGGICMSQTVHSPVHDSFSIGTPVLMRLIEYVRFPGISPSRIALHPLAVAAWGGLLATAINLLPIGQLDGGHIVYAVLGYRWHRLISAVCIALLFVMGFFYWAWWIWAVVLFLFGRRHPLVYDDSELDPARRLLSVTALVILLLSFTVVPVTMA